MISKIQIDQFTTNPFINQNDTKGNDCIVVQIGSESIKFGLASQYAPFVIPNVIAYKISNPKNIENEKKKKWKLK
jgi:actin-related protein